MPNKTRTIWTPMRRAMGNLLPALLFFPFVVIGAVGLLAQDERPGVDPIWRAIWWLAGGIVAGWLALNFLGLYQNGRMRRELARELQVENRRPKTENADSFFVGMARPGYHSIVDAHEDVGFLTLGEDVLEYRGEAIQVVLQKKDVKHVCFRPNAHTLAGLGRWIAIEGLVGGKPVRLLVEPRERQTLLGNLLFGKRLKGRIEGWWRANDKENAH